MCMKDSGVISGLVGRINVANYIDDYDELYRLFSVGAVCSQCISGKAVGCGTQEMEYANKI